MAHDAYLEILFGNTLVLLSLKLCNKVGPALALQQYIHLFGSGKITCTNITPHSTISLYYHYSLRPFFTIRTDIHSTQRERDLDAIWRIRPVKSNGRFSSAPYYPIPDYRPALLTAWQLSLHVTQNYYGRPE